MTHAILNNITQTDVVYSIDEPIKNCFDKILTLFVGIVSY